MAATDPDEIIVVRALTDSDLGWFAAHRSGTASKQRAININSEAASRLLSHRLFEEGGAHFDCTIVFGSLIDTRRRVVCKSGKNWRLGGNKLEGDEFASLGSRDFMLLHSRLHNDGDTPLMVRLVAQRNSPVEHAEINALVGSLLNGSMAAFDSDSPLFAELKRICSGQSPPPLPPRRKASATAKAELRYVPPMPADPATGPRRKLTIREKIRSPHIMERMLQVAGDLSAPAQLRFMQTVEDLASILRRLLLHTGGIVPIELSHRRFWPKVSGMPVGFVDGGLANLSSLGSAPIAARVGGYVVTPGDLGPDREQFVMLKHLIDELFSDEDGGAYDHSFPDAGALRDAARISLEAAGAVQLAQMRPDLRWLLMHGALVNPVSRYSDVMEEGRVRYPFPSFSRTALAELLPGEPTRAGRDRNFISVYLRQLQLLQNSQAIVCGVVERPATTASVTLALLSTLENHLIAPLLPKAPEEWKQWFRHQIDPNDDPSADGQRITDSLLFECVLETGEAIRPVAVDRNEERRAPPAWRDLVRTYPTPYVSYVQVSDWSAPVRLEMFGNQLDRFEDAASLVGHCSMLLPRYGFPAGLDIVDKFAKVPNWMARPISTHTTVQALKRALDSGDTRAFDTLRRMLCGSTREWLMRPGINR